MTTIPLGVDGVQFPPTATHQLALLTAFWHTTGPVLECGAGFYSTPLLSALCAAAGRPLVTYEQNAPWVQYAKAFGHEVVTGEFQAVHPTLTDRRWGLIFVDHTEAARVHALDTLAGHADVIVLHDAPQPVTALCLRYPVRYIDKRWAPETLILAHQPLPWASLFTPA